MHRESSFSNLPNLSGNHRVVAPPESIPNSEVKRNIADGSVGSPHVRVGHFQAPIYSRKRSEKALANNARAFFVYALTKIVPDNLRHFLYPYRSREKNDSRRRPAAELGQKLHPCVSGIRHIRVPRLQLRRQASPRSSEYSKRLTFTPMCSLRELRE